MEGSWVGEDFGVDFEPFEVVGILILAGEVVVASSWQENTSEPLEAAVESFASRELAAFAAGVA